MTLHRRRCETCLWWCRQGAQIAKAERDPSTPFDHGTCQHDTPATVKVVGGWVEAVYPVTHASRFCSSWQPDGAPEPDGGEEISTASEIATGEVLPFDRRAA